MSIYVYPMKRFTETVEIVCRRLLLIDVWQIRFHSF
jgi:hypothetical protein